MANLAIFASGTGSNFEAIVAGIIPSTHRVRCLICNRREAPVLERARRLGIPSHYVPYYKRAPEEAEADIGEILQGYEIDSIALAGFMRLLTPAFVDRFSGRILNIHPSLLPKYPGANAIAESCSSGDKTLGITVHMVDRGMDSGPIVRQETFRRRPLESIEDVTERIHALEHAVYPRVVVEFLDHVERRVPSDR